MHLTLSWRKLSLVGLACLLALPVASCQEETTATEVEEIIRPVRTLQVSDASDLQGGYFIGTARAAREVSLGFAVSGTVAGIPIVIGDKVTKDQIVATLDPAPYQAEVDRLSADLESAIATHDNALEQTKRQRALFERGHVAQSSLDRAEATERSTNAAIASVQGALDRASLNLSYTRLTAPFEGIVVAKFVEDFEEVRAQQQVVRILDGERIEMVVDIPERYIGLARHVTDIQVSFDAIGDIEIPAEITEIGTEASETTRTFPVTLLMSQPEGAQVLPGMTGRARGRVSPDVQPFSNIVVPPGAVFVPEGKVEPHVWVVDTEASTVSARQVAVGEPRSQGLAIDDGLSVGEVIVTAGANSLRAGQKVLLQDAEGGR